MKNYPPLNTHGVEVEELENAINTILRAIGEDPEREGLKGTPERVIRMWKEIYRGYDAENAPAITTFDNEDGMSEMVFDSGDFYSMCEHHMMPFFGQYYFAYVPSPEGRILGISKIARVVGFCAARLQLQERLASDILDMLENALEGKALGFAVVLKGQHMCKTMRGVKNKGNMCVSLFRGAFKEQSALREEFYHLVAMN